MSTSDRFVVKRDATRLRAVHRQRVERHGDAPPRPAGALGGLAPHLRPLALRGFTQLLETEYESVVISGWMSAALCRIGAPVDLVGAFAKVVEDEVRHVDLISALIEDLGETPSLARATLPPPIEMVSGERAIEEVLSGLMGFFCVGEELSGHIFKAALAIAKEPAATWTLGEIFRDEAMHGPFGFEAARVLLSELGPEAKSRLAARVAQEINKFETRLGGPLQGEARTRFSADEEALSCLGLLPREALLSIFYDRVEKNVLPRLADAGLPLDMKVERVNR